MKKEILFACSILLFFSVVILLGGCKSVKYIPIETVTHDTIKQISIDTIQHYERDSVIIETKGDTVFKTAWRTRIDNIVKIKHDTADLAVVPREKPHTGAAAREQPRDSPVIER